MKSRTRGCRLAALLLCLLLSVLCLCASAEGDNACGALNGAQGPDVIVAEEPLQTPAAAWLFALLSSLLPFAALWF